MANMTGKTYLRSVLYFAVTLLVVSILGTIFTNSQIQDAFTAGALAAAAFIVIVLVMGAVKMIDL